MSDLENRLDRASSGEYRLNPDEQRRYLNTFRERVLLAITLPDAKNVLLKAQFDHILKTYDNQSDPIFVKLSGSLPDDLSGFYLKAATNHHFEGQILEEETTDAYGIIIHTDHAIDLAKIDLADTIPDINLTEVPTQAKQKKSLFSKLFG